MGFEKVHFRGEFRDYQSRVINNADKYLDDGRINVVAAPGSGKTVLGLELIRRIGEPCMIFSPTTAIREQWGERFRDLFLDDSADIDTLFSTNLRSIKLVNSITYQALFTAMEKVDTTDGGDDSYTDVDIVREIQSNHIGTICLDEAHHLKNEWQRSLERLISILEGKVKIIALTATPPYDSEGNEWNRYLAMCGDVDEEIFVPELVARDTLCPHQDYVFFNYPTADEIAALKEYKASACSALAEAGTLDFIRELPARIEATDELDKLFSSAKEYIALLVLLRHYGLPVSKRLVRMLVGKRGLPPFKMHFAETAFRFLLEGELLKKIQREKLLSVFKRHSLYKRGKLELVLNEGLKRTLISSVGKLDSIAKIAKSEYSAMGSELRMLVLTDYIKKETLTNIAKAGSWNEISIVSIFETLRRGVDGVRLAVLSGTLVILPDSVALGEIKHSRTQIPDTGYSVVEIPGSTHTAIRGIGELFASGEIQILIGTKSLLGEGWDAPCINSLIMASFVGSYVLSNQMRGRAIRIDKTKPDKCSNIWHLVTVEPDYLFEENRLEAVKKRIHPETEELNSYDYEILKRRFDSFMGPNYEQGTIESGIERITAIKPPYTEEGIYNINDTMLELSHDRAGMRERWHAEVKDGSFTVAVESETEREKRVPVFNFVNIALVFLLAVVEGLAVHGFVRALISAADAGLWAFLLVGISIPVFLIEAYILRLIVMHIDPSRSIKTLGVAVYKTLAECGIISPAAKVNTQAHKSHGYVSIYLRNASIHDQNIFNTAMTELLSPIDNPRYILIKQNKLLGYNYRHSFACPSVIGRKKEYVERLALRLRFTTGNFAPVYTRNENGRALILRCRKSSYITYNHRMMNKKYKVRRWE